MGAVGAHYPSTLEHAQTGMYSASAVVDFTLYSVPIGEKKRFS